MMYMIHIKLSTSLIKWFFPYIYVYSPRSSVIALTRFFYRIHYYLIPHRHAMNNSTNQMQILGSLLEVS